MTRSGLWKTIKNVLSTCLVVGGGVGFGVVYQPTHPEWKIYQHCYSRGCATYWSDQWYIYRQYKSKKLELDYENQICTVSEGGGPFYGVKLEVFAVFEFKRQFTAFWGVLEGFVIPWTPPEIQFYLLGGVARSIWGGQNGAGTPFIPMVWGNFPHI